MITEERINQFNREFPEVLARNLANICVWLENDIELPEEDILRIMKQAEAAIYFSVGLILISKRRGV